MAKLERIQIWIRIGAIGALLMLACLAVDWILFEPEREQTLSGDTKSGNGSRALAPAPGPFTQTALAEESFELPFLGMVRAARVTQQPVVLHTGGTVTGSLVLSVFYDEAGNWIRAEYTDLRRSFTALPRYKLGERYSTRNEEIRSITQGEFPLTLEDAIARLESHIDVSNASRFALTRVNMVLNSDGIVVPVLLGEVFGVRPALGSSQSDEIYKRVRLTFYLEDGVVTEDDVL